MNDRPHHDTAASHAPAPPRDARVPRLVAALTVAVILAGALLAARAGARTTRVALAAAPRGVTVVAAKAASYRRSRAYVGTIAPWLSANVGPQLVAAYVDTVLMRPGAAVRRGDVVATLDCRNASAESQAVAMQARALEARQAALAHEASRVTGLLDGGFVSPNEAEQKTAESASEDAALLAAKAKLRGRALEVDDCVLRAPFDGEVAERMVDPGAFVRPGTAILTIVDRATVRVELEAPEVDFGAVAPGTPVRLHVVATGADLDATISRRAPAADASTRTVRVEIDVADAARAIPVGTTAEATLNVGESVAATEVPLVAASVRGAQAKLFVVEGDAARDVTVAVLGEGGGSLFVAPTLAPGTLVVTEGRALLHAGDRVEAKVEGRAGPAPAAPAGERRDR